MDNQASRGLHHFKNYVGIKFQLYNSLFTSLPFHRIEKTGILLSLFVNICEEGFKKKLSPVEIVEEFLLMAGGNEIEGYMTPNLTNSPDGRIYNWTQEQFIERFRKGRLIPKSPMPWNSFKRTSDDELKAIYKYLKSIPAEKTQELASK